MLNELNTPKPISNYGIIKLLAENLYKTYSDLFGLDITVLRFSTIYGPEKNMGIISNSIKAIKEKNLIQSFLFKSSCLISSIVIFFVLS